MAVATGKFSNKFRALVDKDGTMYPSNKKIVNRHRPRIQHSDDNHQYHLIQLRHSQDSKQELSYAHHIRKNKRRMHSSLSNSDCASIPTNIGLSQVHISSALRELVNNFQRKTQMIIQLSLDEKVKEEYVVRSYENQTKCSGVRLLYLYLQRLVRYEEEYALKMIITHQRQQNYLQHPIICLNFRSKQRQVPTPRPRKNMFNPIKLFTLK